MFQGQKVSREDLFTINDEPVVSDASDDQYDGVTPFDFDIIEVESEISDSEKEEHKDENPSVNKQHTLQLFSNSTSCTINLDKEEPNDISNYFADTFKRDELWDQIANKRKKPLSFYVTDVSVLDSQIKPGASLLLKRKDFDSVAVSGDNIYQSASMPIIKLEEDAIRDFRKVITLADLQPPSPKSKNKRGQSSRLKFKNYQLKFKETKEKHKQESSKREKAPSKKPFLSEKPKFKVTKTSMTAGTSKFRTE